MLHVHSDELRASVHVRHGLVVRSIDLITVAIKFVRQNSTVIMVIGICVFMPMSMVIERDVERVDRVDGFCLVGMRRCSRRDAELHQGDRQQHNQEASHEGHFTPIQRNGYAGMKADRRVLKGDPHPTHPPDRVILGDHYGLVRALHQRMDTDASLAGARRRVRQLVRSVTVTPVADIELQQRTVRGGPGPIMTAWANTKTPGVPSGGLGLAGTAKMGAGARFELTTFRL